MRSKPSVSITCAASLASRAMSNGLPSSAEPPIPRLSRRISSLEDASPWMNKGSQSPLVAANPATSEIVVTPTNVGDEKLLSTAVDIAERLEAAGFEVLLDDRDERPGVKFKDADLVGIPFRITVGKKVTEGTVEVVRRSTRQMEDASISAITEYFKKNLRSVP